MVDRLKSLKQVDVSGRRVFVRVDFNVPLDINGNISSDERIVAALPTLRHLLNQDANQIVIASHLGKPKGKPNEQFSLEVVAKHLEGLLGEPVWFIHDCLGEVPNGKRIVLLENVRFYPGEEDNDEEFALKLLHGCEVYVDDAFGVSHRKHASVVAITRFADVCVAGLLLEEELGTLDITNSKKPVVAILGGAKLSTKLAVIDNLLPKVDQILVGGAMMFTFMKAQGLQVGMSLVEEDFVHHAKELLNDSRIVLPIDAVIADSIEKPIKYAVVPLDRIPADAVGLDVGPETVQEFKNILGEARTVLWNGPLGMFEKKPFDRGTNEVAMFLAGLNSRVKTIIGGGDTIAVLEKLHVKDKFSFVSTGGGASLTYLSGEPLPAVEALEKRT